MAIAPLQCDTCGAAVPLAGGATATCGHCHSPVPIDSAHQELRKQADAARERRREVEAMLRQQLRGVPARVRGLYAWIVIPLVVIGVPAGFLLTQADYGWFAREWVVLAGILPFMVALLPWLVMWSQGSPDAYLSALGLQLRPAPPRPDAVGFDCGVCGAPLEVEPDAYAATCDYCRSDSWVLTAPSDYDHERAEKREASNLADLVSASDFQKKDVRNLLIIYPTVTAIVCIPLYIFLPGRAHLDELRYSKSVGYTYELVGRPGPVVDIAVLGDRLVAISDEGAVLWLDDSLDWRSSHDWDVLGDDGEFLGVVSSGTVALAYGAKGQAAWVRNGVLEVTDTGLDVDLQHAWVGQDGSAVVVGKSGHSAAFEQNQWHALEKTNDNDFEGVWGRDGGPVYAVGGVSVWTRKGKRWRGAMLDKLLLPIAVGGHRDRTYVATRPLDEGETHVVYCLADGEWKMCSAGKRRFVRIVSAESLSFLVDSGGDVSKWITGQPFPHPEPKPGEGPVRSAAFWNGETFVGGADGVFRRTE